MLQILCDGHLSPSQQKTDLFAQACVLRKTKLKVTHKITHLQKNNMQVFVGPLLEEGRPKPIKTIHHLIRLLMESSKIIGSFL